jgi:hypothetical protein
MSIIANVGDRVMFAAFDAGDPLSVGIVEGLVLDAASTSAGNIRYRIMTDEPAPQGAGNIERLVYSHQGCLVVIQPVLKNTEAWPAWLEGKADPADPRSISIPTPGVDNYGGCQE